MRFTDRVVEVIRVSQKMLRPRAGMDSDVGVKSIYNALFGLAQMSACDMPTSMKMLKKCFGRVTGPSASMRDSFSSLYD
jgi:hypothetical protein